MGTTATDTVATRVTNTVRLASSSPAVIAFRCWLATLWQRHLRSSLEVRHDLHGKVLLLLELRRNEIPEPLGLAEMLEESAELR